jgi:hypothetical protein
VEDEVSLRDRIADRLDRLRVQPAAMWARDELIMQIVKRHGPMADDYLDVFSLVCAACSDPEEGRWTTYPCAELQLIARALQVDPEAG